MRAHESPCLGQFRRNVRNPQRGLLTLLFCSFIQFGNAEKTVPFAEKKVLLQLPKAWSDMKCPGIIIC